MKIPGSYPGLTATECGPSHNVCDDVAAIRSLPGIKVADVGDNFELHSLMHTIVKEEGPVYFRVPKVEAPQIFDADYQFAWGKGYMLKSGRDITLLSTGMMTAIALAAADLLDKRNVSAQVIHMPSIKPLDQELIVRAARTTHCLLTIENSRVFGGFGSAVSELISQECPVRMSMMGIGDVPVASANLGSLLRYYHLTPVSVAEKAMEIIAKK